MPQPAEDARGSGLAQHLYPGFLRDSNGVGHSNARERRFYSIGLERVRVETPESRGGIPARRRTGEEKQ